MLYLWGFQSTQEHIKPLCKVLFSLPHTLVPVHPFIITSVQDGKKSNTSYLRFYYHRLHSRSLKWLASVKAVTRWNEKPSGADLLCYYIWTYELRGIYWHVINRTSQVTLLEWCGMVMTSGWRWVSICWTDLCLRNCCQVQFVTCLSCH